MQYPVMEIRIFIAALCCLLPITGISQALIVDFSHPPDEATLQQMEREGTPEQRQQAQAYRRHSRMEAQRAAHGLPTRQQRMRADMAAQADGSGLPDRFASFEAMLTQLQQALQRKPTHMAEGAKQADIPEQLAPLTRQPLLDKGCALALSTPAGVELREGGLNGNLSLYRCEDFHILAHEYDFSRPMRARIVLDAQGHEKHPGTERYKVREMSFPARSGELETMLSWISPGYEIRLNIYTPAGRAQFAPQLDQLTALLETVAAERATRP